MPESKPRDVRKAVSLLVKLNYFGLDDFVEKYATNISPGGMFIRSREPKPVGTEVRFKVELANGLRVLQGSATVKWVRQADDPAGPPGMGLQFLELDEQSKALVDRMVGQNGAKRAAAGAPAAKAPPSKPAAAPAKAPSAAAPKTAAPPKVSPPAAPPKAAKPAPAPVAPAASKEIDLDSLLDDEPLVVPPTNPAKEVDVPLDLLLGEPTGEGEEEIPLEGEALPMQSSASAAFDFDLALNQLPGAQSPPKAPAKPAAPAPKAAAQKSPAVVDEGFELDLEGSSAPQASASADGGFDFDFEAPPPPPSKPAPKPSPGKPAAAAKPAGAKPAAKPAPPPPASVREDSIEFNFDEDPGPPLQADTAAAPVVAGALLPEIRRGPAPPQVAPPSVPQTLKVGGPPPAPTRRPPGALVFLKPPEKLIETGPIIGIDLGTTNSCVAVLSNGKPRVLRSKEGYSTIPSVVGLNSKGLLTVGHRAKQQIVLSPQLTIYGAKRLVGRDFDSPTVRAVKERFRYEVVPGPDGKSAVQLGQHTLSLEEVQGLILKEMKEFAEQYLNQPVHRAVVTCPAYYSEQQREAVRKAGRLAGLKVERVLNEPTAAALAYGLNRELTRRVLVFDLGGGTFDATLLRIDKNVFEVLATGGDVFLGGLDFDNLIVDLLLQKFHEQHKVEFSGDPVALSRVTDQAEKAKVALSETQGFDVHLPMLQMMPDGRPLDLKCSLSRDELTEVAKPLVDRCIDVVNDVLLDAKMRAAEVDDIILVGGMTRMPLVRKGIEAFFKKTPQASVNADEAVALGAALYSGTVDKVSSVTLIDVVPMTIGVGMAGGAFKRIIERNSPLPATKSFSVGTARDNDEVVEVNVFQGEDNNVTGNDYLGTVRIEGLPKAKKGQVQVALTLSLDGECVLRVEARDLVTKRTFKSNLATRYTSDEIRTALGVTAKGPSEQELRRAQELQSRAGSFWGRLKKVFGLKKG